MQQRPGHLELLRAQIRKCPGHKGCKSGGLFHGGDPACSSVRATCDLLRTQTSDTLGTRGGGNNCDYFSCRVPRTRTSPSPSYFSMPSPISPCPPPFPHLSHSLVQLRYNASQGPRQALVPQAAVHLPQLQQLRGNDTATQGQGPAQAGREGGGPVSEQLGGENTHVEFRPCCISSEGPCGVRGRGETRATPAARAEGLRQPGSSTGGGGK